VLYEVNGIKCMKKQCTERVKHVSLSVRFGSYDVMRCATGLVQQGENECSLIAGAWLAREPGVEAPRGHKFLFLRLFLFRVEPSAASQQLYDWPRPRPSEDT
jgi:hypothetical protein